MSELIKSVKSVNNFLLEFQEMSVSSDYSTMQPWQMLFTFLLRASILIEK